MKVLSIKPELCTGCRLCEEACAEKWFKVKDREKSAVRVYQPAKEQDSYQIVACTQCGACIDICPTKAIARTRHGIVRLDKKLCVGCLACVGFCDIWAMRTAPDEVVPFKCVACGNCVKVCPEGVLSIGEMEEPKPSETEKWAERVAA